MSSLESMTLVSFPKLSSNNYEQWSNDMRYLLMEKGCWEIVEGTELEPTSTGEKYETMHDREVRDFRRRKGIAMASVYHNIEAGYKTIVDGLMDPTEAWKRLKAHYCPDNRSRHMEIFTALCNCRILPNESISLFSARLNRIAENLSAIDPSFSKSYICYQFLRYLPENFDTAVHLILRWDDERFVMPKIVAELVAEEARQNLRQKDMVSAQLSERNPRSSTRRSDAIICHRCGLRGHFKKNCYVKLPVHSKVNDSNVNSNVNDSVFHYRNSRNSPRRHQYGNRRRSSSRNSFQRSKSRNKYQSKAYFVSANISNLKSNDNSWVLDSAASHHFCHNFEYFKNFQNLTNSKLLCAAKNVEVQITGKGDIDLDIDGEIVTLKDVFFTPQLRCNLLSLPRCDKGGAKFIGENGVLKIFHGDKTPMLRAYLKDGIYRVNVRCITPSKDTVTSKVFLAKNKIRKSFHSSADKLKSLHRRFAHINPTVIQQTAQCDAVRGLKVFRGSREFECDSCKLHKFKSVSFKPIANIRSQKPLELLHSDVWGPIKHRGRSGQFYFVSVIDDYSRRAAVFPIIDKTRVFQVVKSYINRMENQLGLKVKNFRSDNGREYVNANFQAFFNQRGIRHEPTNYYTPQQNGVSERFNQTVIAGARTVLNESGMHFSFWPDAVKYFTYTWNRVCRTGLRNTPHELFFGTKPAISHLKPFGTVAFVYIPKAHRESKLSARALKGFFIGYSNKTRGFKVWLDTESRVIHSSNVSVKENRFYRDEIDEPAKTTKNIICHSPAEYDGFEDDIQTQPKSVDPTSDDRSTPTTNGDATETETDDSDTDTVTNVTWNRIYQPRPYGNRADVYFLPSNSNRKLRTLKEIENFCQRNRIDFDPSMFVFSSKDKTVGTISTKISANTADCS